MANELLISIRIIWDCMYEQKDDNKDAQENGVR